MSQALSCESTLERLKKALAKVIKDERFCQIIATPVPPKKDGKAEDK